MKTINLFRLLVCIVLLFVFSCKKQGAMINDNPASSGVSAALLNDPNFVPLATASKAAEQAPLSPLTSKLSKQNTAPSPKTILNYITVPDNVTPSYYIFNYTGGGYVIIPADSRVQPILAYSDKGSIAKSGRISLGLGNWLEVNHKNMVLLRTKPALKQPSDIGKLWSGLVGTSAAGGNQVNRVPIQVCQDSYTTTVTGPLLPTEWGQGFPYNQTCPGGNYSFGHVPTGCVATAMAQVMYYWKAPYYFNWPGMPLTTSYQSNFDVAFLMASIGVSVEMDYNDSGSAPHTDIFSPSGISCTDALKNSFGYGSAAEGDFNISTAENNLYSGMPVLLSGTTDDHSFLFWEWGYDGHEWVTDGAEDCTSIVCLSEDTSIGETFTYLHMNWGWNETWTTSNVNGWYGFGVWQVLNGSTVENYQYNKKMTYNIHP
ncbi:C10 family peptidase [Mucilaginibacter sp. AW1-3]